MELVYLWIEKYKNIEKQGFNFSPKYRCEFKAKYKENGELDEKNSELIIEENKGYVNLFPENINITAIVGKNGAGKSSVLEIIGKFIVNDNNDDIKFLVIYIKDRKFYIWDKFNFVKNKLNLIEIENNSEIGSIFFSSNFTNGFFNNFIDDFSSPVRIYYKNKTLLNQSLLNLFSNAGRVVSYHNSHSAYYNMDAFLIKDIIENYIIGKSIIIIDFLRRFPIEKLFDIKSDFVQVEISLDYRVCNRLGAKYNTYGKVFEEYFHKYNDICKEEFEENSKIDKEQYKKIKSFMNFLKNKKLFDIDKYKSVVLSLDESFKLLELFLEVFKSLNIKEKNILNIKFPDFSSGEENLILLLALLELGFTGMKKNRYTNFVLLLDEIENNFHTGWQKKLLDKFLNFIQIINYFKFNNKAKFHVMVTTHSPFIISDLPKQNIIFLDKDENGKCRVVDGLNEKKETFGANIHTLLSDSFFMEDGLIGKFAESKINEVIKYLNNENSEIKDDDEAQKIIDIIGEPILKKELQRKLDSKRLAKVDEIEEIKSEIEKLKNKLKILENEKNNNN